MDPEWKRFKQKFPKFPGVPTYVDLLRQYNIRGATVDFILAELQDHARTTIDELISAFRNEQDERVRILLLSVIAESALPQTFPLFVENLRADNASLRRWAVWGLKALDTKEARQVLWEARSYTLATVEETIAFREELEEIRGRKG